MRKKFMIQAWDQLNNRWMVPFCDMSYKFCKEQVKTWIQDLVLRNQLPLWALENYAQAADEEGETFLRRERMLLLVIREYEFTLGPVSYQKIRNAWRVSPGSTDKYGSVLWQAERINPAAIRLGWDLRYSPGVSLSWTKPKIDWEFVPYKWCDTQTQHG